MKENKIKEFLNLKDKELFNYYNRSPEDIQKLMNNVYNACYRFNLNNTQTLYMLQEAVKPFKQDILINMLID